jgi:hypothetical protein
MFGLFIIKHSPDGKKSFGERYDFFTFWDRGQTITLPTLPVRGDPTKKLQKKYAQFVFFT